MSNRPTLFASIDAGGTTFKCGLANMSGDILVRQRFKTGAPEETIQACANFLSKEAGERGADILALGIASFGPVDVDRHSKSYGAILDTPKRGWSGVNLRDEFAAKLGVPVVVDTDVNGALLAENGSGAAMGVSSSVYMTVGTGIGAGIYSSGQLVGKPRHPEFGHIYLRRHPNDTYAGTCPFHGDCLEGLASAPAFTARFGDPKSLDVGHPGWDILAYYLAQACWSLSLSFRADRILLGGGLMLAPHILEKVREQYLDISAGYLSVDHQSVGQLIMRPAHGDDAGLMGGFVLAQLSDPLRF